MQIEAIGTIHTPFARKADCPIQPVYAEAAEGRVELFEAYAAGLEDIETFSHIYLLYRFHRAGEVQLVRPTFLDDVPHGIFASRHPSRPNGIGFSIVRLVARRDNCLQVSGVDLLDKTPLLDLKPYIPRFDRIDTATDGWVGDRPWRPKPDGRE